MSAFERGYLDGINGKSIMDCPYHKSSGEAIAWRNGWCEARMVMDNNMTYHHTVSGLASVVSVRQYEYNDHVEAWLRSQIKVVGPNWYGLSDMSYQATIGDYDLDCKCGYGYSPEEARNELMASLGY